MKGFLVFKLRRMLYTSFKFLAWLSSETSKTPTLNPKPYTVFLGLGFGHFGFGFRAREPPATWTTPNKSLQESEGQSEAPKKPELIRNPYHQIPAWVVLQIRVPFRVLFIMVSLYFGDQA